MQEEIERGAEENTRVGVKNMNTDRWEHRDLDPEKWASKKVDPEFAAMMADNHETIRQFGLELDLLREAELRAEQEGSDPPPHPGELAEGVA